MSALKTIRTRNIQSHKDVLIELPETGLVVFTGDNSNGKSVITKVLDDLISYSISNLRVRKSDINRDCNEGSLEITKYDGSSLYLNLNIEASQTWVRLTRANGETVTRYLADKTIPDLVREFGFHYNKDRDISLNVCEPDASVLFFGTSHATNGDIITSALTDPDAQMRYDVLYDQYKQATVLRQNFIDDIKINRAALTSMQMYDIEDLERKIKQARRLENVMSHVFVPEIRELPKQLAIRLIKETPVKLRTLYEPRVIEVIQPRQRDLSKLQEELDYYMRGECPTCHRPFYSHQTCTSET